MTVKRATAAVGTVVVAAATNVTTGELTQRWALAWWASTAALVVVGGGLQIWLTAKDLPEQPSHALASGDGAIAAAGSVRRVSARVTRQSAPSQPAPPAGQGIIASGAGAIAAGGDIEDAQTDVAYKDPETP